LDSFIFSASTFNLLALFLLAGIVITMLVINTYILSFDKDKLLGFYNIYLFASLLFITWNFYKLINTGSLHIFLTVDATDELVSTIPGIAYLLFFDYVFSLQKAPRFVKIFWYTGIAAMFAQLVYLLIVIIRGDNSYFNFAVWYIIFCTVSIGALAGLIYAFTIRFKSAFQKNILLGAVLFYILILLANMQEHNSRQGFINGISFLFVALTSEHLIFALASASRIRSIYKEAEKGKLAEYRHQLKTEQVINYFATSLVVKSSLDDLLWDVAQNCISKLGFEDCVIYLIDEKRNVLIQKAAWGPKTTEENKIINPIAIPIGRGIVGAVAFSNKPALVNDTSVDSRYIIDDAVRLSEIAVPISINSRVFGVIDSEHPDRNFYNEGHLQVLSTIASLIANCIERIEAEQLAREKELEILRLKTSNYQYQLEIEKIVNFFATAISSHHSVDDMLWDVSKNLIGQLDFEECMIYLWNEDKNLLIQRAGHGLKGDMRIEENKNVYHVPKGKGIVGAAADSGECVLVNDTSKDNRYFSADQKIMFSELSVPIIHKKETIGVINTEYSKKNFFTNKHLTILSTIASLCADKIDKINAEQQTRIKEIEVLRLNKDLAQSQLTALRAQMNPHFIFNALNSVQQYILQGNTDEANRYLSKFSKLQRDILNNSDQAFITLEKEKEILELYLQLEQLRFNGNFDYAILIDESLDITEIKIPPMLVQPFVENAIWHGLMPKHGERKVAIQFILNGDILECLITDNGIGREAAARLKEKANTSYQSKGMTIVNERMKILRQQYQQPFEVVVADMIDAKKKSTGTQVLLKIYAG
jgi:two-component system, LytTR family, sensor kinase